MYRLQYQHFVIKCLKYTDFANKTKTKLTLDKKLLIFGG